MAGIAIPLAISGISALAGLFGNRKKTFEQTQDTSSTSNSTQNVDVTDSPQYTPEMQAVMELLANTFRNRLVSGTDLTGYTAQGMQKINQGADLRRKMMDNVLAARGLTFSPAGANSIGRLESSRIGEQTSFLNSIPLLQRQLQGEDLDAFSKFFSSLPVAQRRTGTTTTNTTSTGTAKGTNTDPGNMLGGLFGGLGAGLAYGYGQGAFNRKKPSGLGIEGSSMWGGQVG